MSVARISAWNLQMIELSASHCGFTYMALLVHRCARNIIDIWSTGLTGRATGRTLKGRMCPALRTRGNPIQPASGQVGQANRTVMESLTRAGNTLNRNSFGGSQVWQRRPLRSYGPHFFAVGQPRRSRSGVTTLYAHIIIPNKVTNLVRPRLTKG